MSTLTLGHPYNVENQHMGEVVNNEVYEFLHN